MSSKDRYLWTLKQTKYTITGGVESIHIAVTNTLEGDTDSCKWIVWEAQEYSPLLYAALVSGLFCRHFLNFAFDFGTKYARKDAV